jgi:hypothetical protein
MSSMNSCSGSTSLADCNINYALPASGNAAADWVIGGIYTSFYISICFETYRAFKQKRTLKVPWIGLSLFAGFRAVGYLMRAWSDDNQPQPDSTFAQAENWTKILTASYSIINAGTTFFLIFLGSLAIAYRRCCAAAANGQNYIDGEKTLRKREDSAFIGYRIFVVAVAVLNIIGSLRQFDYYWLDYSQGITLRKAGGWIQILVTVFLVIIVSSSSFTYRMPTSTRKAFSLVISVYLIYMVSLAFNLVRVYRPLDDKVNVDSDYAYCLQALPDFINLFALLLFKYDRLLDYQAVGTLSLVGEQEFKY